MIKICYKILFLSILDLTNVINSLAKYTMLLYHIVTKYLIENLLVQ